MQPGGDVARAEGADGKAADAKKVAKAKKKIEKQEKEEVDVAALRQEAQGKADKLLNNMKETLDFTNVGGEPTLKMIRAYGKLCGLGSQIKNVFTAYADKTGEKNLALADGKSLSSDKVANISSVLEMIGAFSQNRFKELKANVTAGIEQFITSNRNTPFSDLHATSDIQESRLFAGAYLHSGIATESQKDDLRKIVSGTKSALAARINQGGVRVQDIAVNDPSGNT
jgi:hypothetical protein